jgi:hypothetical protein
MNPVPALAWCHAESLWSTTMKVMILNGFAVEAVAADVMKRRFAGCPQIDPEWVEVSPGWYVHEDDIN